MTLCRRDTADVAMTRWMLTVHRDSCLVDRASLADAGEGEAVAGGWQPYITDLRREGRGLSDLVASSPL